MTALNVWLAQATRRLSAGSAAQVRREILAHYESGREAAMAGGASGDEAERQAVAALGDARAANCAYRKVLLTAAEERTLREGDWEARTVCSRPWVQRMLLVYPAAALLLAGGCVVAGWVLAARILLVVAVGTALLFAAPRLPVYTPGRARVFRIVKWTVLLGAIGAVMGANLLQWSWLLIACFWPVFWVEWTRISIRRKLKVADWPKHLYL